LVEWLSIFTFAKLSFGNHFLWITWIRNSDKLGFPIHPWKARPFWIQYTSSNPKKVTFHFENLNLMFLMFSWYRLWLYFWSFWFTVQSNLVIMIVVITNSQIQQTKFWEFFGPNWWLYYIKLHSYNCYKNVKVIMMSRL
jgi:hypothetical protein